MRKIINHSNVQKQLLRLLFLCQNVSARTFSLLLNLLNDIHLYIYTEEGCEKFKAERYV